MSWHFVPIISSSPQTAVPSNPPIIPPAVAPIQLASPFIFTGADDLIMPYSTEVTFWVSLVLTFVGEVLEHAYMSSIDKRDSILIIYFHSNFFINFKLYVT